MWLIFFKRVKCFKKLIIKIKLYGVYNKFIWIIKVFERLKSGENDKINLLKGNEIVVLILYKGDV